MHAFYLKPSVARKLAVRHTNLVCLTASFLATCGFIKLYYKIPWLFRCFQIPWFFHAWNFFGWFSRFSMISRACGNPILPNPCVMAQIYSTYHLLIRSLWWAAQDGMRRMKYSERAPPGSVRRSYSGSPKSSPVCRQLQRSGKVYLPLCNSLHS